ncbi:hypothetical protein LEP1GSC133_2704 [Leptospira borgpetersenii serovar Pomona str. 200901868]|uniref:Uncharacterized protein n=1 Tax=Leptospira borgpetersenii serovar Pomona str. 200901868 TaxID=1192866 RepID=M6WBS2_LEPBO|nr:hypothetical protein LEP1GSC133_2704 [Leptospira borgpetersenii serovar Pomona str. 200901868]
MRIPADHVPWTVYRFSNGTYCWNTPVEVSSILRFWDKFLI